MDIHDENRRLMDEAPAPHLQELGRIIDRGGYRVPADKVAEAFLQWHVEMARWMSPSGARDR